VCTTCKPTLVDESSEIVPGSCRQQYSNVTDCMTLNNGSISECKSEWSAFRKCFNKVKVGNHIGSVQPPPAASPSTATCGDQQQSSACCTSNDRC